MFKKLDKDGSGGLSEAEIMKGFAAEFEVAELAAHVAARLKETFDKVSKLDETGEMSLPPGKFSRFYCEAIFHQFDVNQNGTLQLDEVQSALGYLVKPDADGVRQLPVIAYPPEHTDASGELRLPVQWFWALFSSMD